MSTLIVTVLLMLLSCVMSLPVTSRPGMERIRTSNDQHWFLDESGRVRIFHGVNIVSKEFPWYRDYLFNKTRMDEMRDWGFNIVRLGTMWAGAEPTKGKYNMSYVGVLKKAVVELEERGIYSMLDMHQDCLTSRYQSYDGVPRWLVDQYPEPTNPFPWPLQSIGAWEEKYLTQAVSEAFQHFYNNVANSVDLWADFWQLMAQTFSSTPAVIGYNLINEPWIGDFYKDLRLAFPGIAGKRNLLPAYDIINTRIRQHDKKAILFYEPVFYGQTNHGAWLGSGFDRLPGGSTYGNVSAYSFHMYCWALEFMPPDASDEQRRDARDFCYEKFLPQIMASARRNVDLTGGGQILTEFGLCKTGQGKQINVECGFFLDLCDDNLMSWIEWDYNDNTWYRDGVPVMEKVLPHVRPYARAIAGIPRRMKFEDKTKTFTLQYDTNPSIAKPTEIFVPKLRYTDGFHVKVSAGLRWELEGNNKVLIYSQVQESTLSTVTILPK